ncbi:hypothetical protein AB0L82_04000 [Nocardia sp. NPDC052001]|uniref:hypothetical protein n=1 Tax=Nocardia sp. NPDC052001 TaxID=3154853 RepID=UPI00342A15B6
MNIKHRAGVALAGLTMATALTTTAGHASADIPLTPTADTSPAATVADAPSGSGAGSATGSFNLLGPLLNSESGWAQANHLPDFSSFSAEAAGSSVVQLIWPPILSALLSGSGICTTCATNHQGA